MTMMVHMSIWILALVGAAWTASGQSSVYAAKEESIGAGRKVLRVYNRKTGRTVWTRQVHSVSLIRWSQNGRALAVVDNVPSSVDNPWWLRVIAWRVGEGVRIFQRVP